MVWHLCCAAFIVRLHCIFAFCDRRVRGADSIINIAGSGAFIGRLCMPQQQTKHFEKNSRPHSLSIVHCASVLLLRHSLHKYKYTTTLPLDGLNRFGLAELACMWFQAVSGERLSVHVTLMSHALWIASLDYWFIFTDTRPTIHMHICTWVHSKRLQSNHVSD